MRTRFTWGATQRLDSRRRAPCALLDAIRDHRELRRRDRRPTASSSARTCTGSSRTRRFGARCSCASRRERGVTLPSTPALASVDAAHRHARRRGPIEHLDMDAIAAMVGLAGDEYRLVSAAHAVARRRSRWQERQGAQPRAKRRRARSRRAVRRHRSGFRRRDGTAHRRASRASDRRTGTRWSRRSTCRRTSTCTSRTPDLLARSSSTVSRSG